MDTDIEFLNGAYLVNQIKIGGLIILESIRFVIAIMTVFYIVMSMTIMIKVMMVPSPSDRGSVNAINYIIIMTTIISALIGALLDKGIYMDIAIAVLIVGFLGTTLISRYLEGKR